MVSLHGLEPLMSPTDVGSTNTPGYDCARLHPAVARNVLRWHCLFSGVQTQFWFRRLELHSRNLIDDDGSWRREALWRRDIQLLLKNTPASSGGVFTINMVASMSRARGENISVTETWKLLGADYRDHVVVGICARDIIACTDHHRWKLAISVDISMLMSDYWGSFLYHNFFWEKRRDVMSSLEHSFRNSVFLYVDEAWQSRGFQRPRPRLRRVPQAQRHDVGTQVHSAAVNQGPDIFGRLLEVYWSW